MADAFGQALLDHYRGERDAPLRQRDGDDVKTHPVGDFYFDEFGTQPGADWIETWLDGPLVDLGAGAGRDALYFQDRVETVALEISDALVTLLRERGVDRVRQGDMFALRESVPADRFGSALVLGTQLGLAGSMAGLRAFLDDLAAVTTPDATAVVDGYDPAYGTAPEMLGFRADPAPGLAARVYYYEYAERVGAIRRLRLFTPDRLRKAATGTDWTVAEIDRPGDAYYYRAAVAKS